MWDEHSLQPSEGSSLSEYQICLWSLENYKVQNLGLQEKSCLIYFLITTVNTDFQTSPSDKWDDNSDQEVRFKKL